VCASMYDAKILFAHIARVTTICIYNTRNICTAYVCHRKRARSPRRVFLVEFFSISPRTYDLNSLRCLFFREFLLLRFFLILSNLHLIICILYSILYVNAHMETFLQMCVCVCVYVVCTIMWSHVTRRGATAII
jgi:hypothetical protein